MTKDLHYCPLKNLVVLMQTNNNTTAVYNNTTMSRVEISRNFTPPKFPALRYIRVQSLVLKLLFVQSSTLQVAPRAHLGILEGLLTVLIIALIP